MPLPGKGMVKAKRSYDPPMPLPYEPQSASPLVTMLILVGLLASARLASSRGTLDVQVKYLQVLGLIASIASVSIPGRFDDDGDVLFSSPWPTLFSPAGYAFAIWGVIYIGELSGVVAAWRAPLDAFTTVHDDSSRAWLCANLAQALWCLCFRQWSLSQLWLPSLGAQALLLLSAHASTDDCKLRARSDSRAL